MVGWLHRLGPCGHRQAFLQQCLQPFFAHALVATASAKSNQTPVGAGRTPRRRSIEAAML